MPSVGRYPAFLQPLLEEMDPLKPMPWYIVAILIAVFAYSSRRARPNSTFLNPRRRFELTDKRPLSQYFWNSRALFRTWFNEHPNKAACVITDIGDTTILPPGMANEVRNDARLSFTAFSIKFFQTRYPGFEAFNEGTRDNITLTVINKDLTKHLAKITEPLADETTLTLRDLLGKDTEWREITLKDTVLHLVARISSRVFLGEELCRNEAWLKITREHATNGFKAGDVLRQWPEYLRPFVHWFIPECSKLRSQIRQARSIISPVIEQRRRLKAISKGHHGKEAEFNDAIEWFEQAAKGGDYDPAVSQLFLSTVAIHTTTDLLCQTMIDLANNPEIIEPLRTEIISTLSEGGWQKTSLYNMKLLDSAIKESQRMKPLQLASMQRVALAHVTLSDGTFIPKGTASCVSSHRLWDPDVYSDPEQWDAYRFLHQRQLSGKEHVAQLVSTSENHLGFGHGKHACPGRFFASNELKIALVHLLRDYQWRLPKGKPIKVHDFGISPMLDQDIRMEIRAR